MSTFEYTNNDTRIVLIDQNCQYCYDDACQHNVYVKNNVQDLDYIFCGPMKASDIIQSFPNKLPESGLIHLNESLYHYRKQDYENPPVTSINTFANLSGCIIL